MSKRIIIFAAAVLCLLLCLAGCGEGGSESETSESTAAETEYKGPEATLTLIRQPVKTLYCAGEYPDTTGLVIDAAVGGDTERVIAPAYSGKALTEGQTSYTLTYKKGSVEIPVTVVGGSAAKFKSTYSQKKYDALIQNYGKSNTREENSWYASFDAENRLPNRFADGSVTTRDELAEYVDYHVFYHIESIIVKPEWAFSSADDILDDLYYRSGLIASNASLLGNILEDGYLQIMLRYYDTDLLTTDLSHYELSDYIAPEIAHEQRSADYIPEKISADGVTVYNSEQAVYALINGFKVSAVAGSPAEKLLDRAVEILRVTCADSMTDTEKMYSLVRWFLKNTKYDYTGEDWCAGSLDCQYEPDMLGALLTSFHAEGPLLYGSSVCYGYAKAYGMMLSLEGLEVKRVNGHSRNTEGRSTFEKLSGGSYDSATTAHSYLYVKSANGYYLSDITFSCAGTVECGSGRAAWYRDMALALTKAEHAQIYKDNTDLFSESAEYVPDSFDALSAFGYSGKSILIGSVSEADDYLSSLDAEVKASSSKYVSFCMFIEQSADNAVNAKIDSYLSSSFKNYRLGADSRTVNGKTYKQYLILAEK